MILDYKGVSPRLGARCYVAENAAVIGDVVLGEDCSVWFGASVRGDAASVTVGDRTNIQDNVTIHCSAGVPTGIGSGVSIGHNAVVHSAVLEDDVLVGMGAVVLDGAVIGAGSVIGAGAVVTKNTVVPPNSLVMGIPGRVIRSLPAGENASNARDYVLYKEEYREEKK